MIMAKLVMRNIMSIWKDFGDSYIIQNQKLILLQAMVDMLVNMILMKILKQFLNVKDGRI